MDNSSETCEPHIINEYNLETRQWESSHDMKQVIITNEDQRN